MTVLHLAVLHKFFIVVRYLVEDCKVDVNCVSHSVAKATPLHMAYGIGEESIAQYLIEHGANQDALDSDGSKPIDYKLYFNPRKKYVIASQFFIKRQIIRQDLFSREHAYFSELVEQGHDEEEAILLTFDNFFHLYKKALMVIIPINKILSLLQCQKNLITTSQIWHHPIMKLG